MATIKLKIHGMDCGEEVFALKAELQPMQGIKDLAFDVLNGKMTVDYSEAQITPDHIQRAVAKTGMRAENWQEAPTATTTGWQRWGRTAMTTASGLLLLCGFIASWITSGFAGALGGEEFAKPSIISIVFYIGAAICGAWYVAPKGLRALLRLRPDMNLLMVIAVIGAVFIGEYFEAATVAFLFAVSLALESWSVGRARRAIAALMSLTPDTARLKAADGSEPTVSVSDVSTGSVVIVLPGEKFPLDGTITKGTSTVNQAPITGESMPVAKTTGDPVYAGTINQDGAVEFETTKAAEDTTLARIIRMVGDAQSKRSPSEQWVEKFARYYTPAVMALAVAVIVLRPLVVGTWNESLYQGLVLLVIACPCALVISTPVSIVAALTGAARRGVLVKGGAFMEIPAKLRAIALDKTGTLTEGEPQVRSVIPLAGYKEDEVLALAAAIESRSEHPLARAVIRAAKERNITFTAAADFQAQKGRGATALVNGKRLWLGSHRLLEERGQETAEMHKQLDAMEKGGSSVIVIGNDEHVCGLIALADRIRPGAAAAVASMRTAGIEHIVMLTGDNKGTGEAVGREAGVDEVRAQLLPEDKVTAIEELVREYHSVAMIGDGVNDAPAMARATVGVAMGAIGTDAALETADIALMGDDLSALGWLVQHSRRTLTVIKQNIFASLAVKAIFVVLTLAGQSSLWTAIMADMGTSLVVIFNGLRMLKTK